MDNKLNDLKIEKIIQEYTFLKTDEEYKKELINSNQSEFLNIINQCQLDKKISNIYSKKFTYIYNIYDFYSFESFITIF